MVNHKGVHRVWRGEGLGPVQDCAPAGLLPPLTNRVIWEESTDTAAASGYLVTLASSVI
jgi:hypothetical protein